MLLTTGVIALSRKVADERAKKKELKQGHLNVGNSDVAKQAFKAQTTKMIESGEAGINRRGTEIKYEDPSDVVPASPSVTSPSTKSPVPDVQETRHTFETETNVLSPVKSEHGMLGPGSPYTTTSTSPSDERSVRSSTYSQPPPYSPGPASSTSVPSLSMYSPDTDGNSWDTKSISTQSTNSNGGKGLRIKTIGSDLKSGFPYHPALFELQVHPEKWSNFTSQVVETTKVSGKDAAGAWAAATATAMTGAIGTAIVLGRSMTRANQEKKVKAGLTDMSDGGLGDTLQHWNDDYFSRRGLYVHLELSESAMKNAGQKSKAFRKGTFLYSNPEDRERKKDERKFVIVVTKLDDDGEPSDALREMNVAEKRGADEKGAVEIATSDVPASIPELPGEEDALPAELPAPAEPAPVELPAETVGDSEKDAGPPSGYVEMDSDNTHLLEKMQLDDTGPWVPASSIIKSEE